jgi:hypothetical protein
MIKRKASNEPNNGMLGGTIRCVSRRSPDSGIRADSNETGTAAGDKASNGVSGHEECAGQIHGKRPVPVLVGDLCRFALDRNAGSADNPGERAKAVDRRAHRHAHLIVKGDIGGHRKRTAPQGFYFMSNTV